MSTSSKDELMRAIILMLVVFGTGCKTAEVSVSYPIMGLRVHAKFEGKDEPAISTDRAEFATFEEEARVEHHVARQPQESVVF